MKTGEKGLPIKKYREQQTVKAGAVSANNSEMSLILWTLMVFCTLMLAVWLFLLSNAMIGVPSIEAVRAPADTHHSPVAAIATDSIAEQETVRDGTASTHNPDLDVVEWTFMVYMAADDNTFETAAINDFLEMASVGSNSDFNVVVQLDRIPDNDTSYGNWDDSRRFLITEGLTPTDGNEIMSLGEVNMGDPGTLVAFVEWTVSNYPAEKYALILSSHGKGWGGCCWDESSANDNLKIAEMRDAFREISDIIGRPLDLAGFDACLMGMVEVAYEISDYASVMVASEHAEPIKGWPYDTILLQLAANTHMDPAQLASLIVDSYYASHAPIHYTLSAIDLTKIDNVVLELNGLAQALANHDEIDGQDIKALAEEVLAALDKAVIHEKHGSRWAGSHGLAIYFPKTLNSFDPAYSSGAVSFANDTGWMAFLNSYYAAASANWITTARDNTQQYYYIEHIDLYDFCLNLIDGLQQ